jgi:hypothetical protein
LAGKEEELKILQHKEIACRENAEIKRTATQQALQEQVKLGLPKSKTPPNSLNIPGASTTSTASATTEQQGESVPVWLQEEVDHNDGYSSTSAMD